MDPPCTISRTSSGVQVERASVREGKARAQSHTACVDGKGMLDPILLNLVGDILSSCGGQTKRAPLPLLLKSQDCYTLPDFQRESEKLISSAPQFPKQAFHFLKDNGLCVLFSKAPMVSLLSSQSLVTSFQETDQLGEMCSPSKTTPGGTGSGTWVSPGAQISPNRMRSTCVWFLL